MPLRFAVTLTLALAGLARTAAAQSQERHYLLYLATATNCAGASSFRTRGTSSRSREPGRCCRPHRSPRTRRSRASSACSTGTPRRRTTPSTEVCQPAPSVKGDEVCQQLLQFTASGFTIQSFTPAAGFQANRTNRLAQADRWQHRGAGPASLGTITLIGTAAGGIFRLQSGDYIESDAAKRTARERRGRAGGEHLRQWRPRRRRGVR